MGLEASVTALTMSSLWGVCQDALTLRDLALREGKELQVTQGQPAGGAVFSAIITDAHCLL